MGSQSLGKCPRCGLPVKPAPVAVAPLTMQIGDLLARPFSKEGLVTAAALAIPGGLAGIPHIGWMLALIYLAGTVSFYFQVIDHVGQSRPGLPSPTDWFTDWFSVVGQLFRGTLCVLVAIAPLLAWLVWGAPPRTPATGVATEVALVALGQLYMPAALVTVVLGNSTLGAIYPIAWVKVIARAPVSYAQFVGIYLISLAIGGVVYLVALLLLGWLPFVGTFLVLSIAGLLFIVQAVLVGGFLRRNAEQFGYDD